ncbi:MAG TPA: MaoC family dehydratase [Phenylobacterium sp.]|uniref:MaoC family dehydratase n=1 Tax=Phenylobacterium sp. TaxID=1871053 RepID=UPI002B48078A|nr:MaoC family dehydratase [Phenylobacterium sp.]HKR88063.1 MaoC family dehydratase [Phenylobacterium sp.]
MQGLYFEDLTEGQSAEMTRVASAAVVEAFAEVSGDVNPVHLDEAYARTTSFGGRIAHGALAAAYISAVIGVKMPGPGAVFLTQSLRFRRPIRLGDPVTARVTIKTLIPQRAHAVLATACEVNGKTVVDGEALVMIPRRPK